MKLNQCISAYSLEKSVNIARNLKTSQCVVSDYKTDTYTDNYHKIQSIFNAIRR